MALLVAVVLGVRVFEQEPDRAPPSPGSAPPGGTSNAVVVQVADGDTFEADVGGANEQVRLIGIDTPESVATDRPDECYGGEASNHLEALLPPGTHVRLERDVEARDRYERLLAYVYRTDDGLFVNHNLVARGFAEAKAYPPNTAREADFAAAEAQARRAGAGLWGACGNADVPLEGQG